MLRRRRRTGTRSRPWRTKRIPAGSGATRRPAPPRIRRPPGAGGRWERGAGLGREREPWPRPPRAAPRPCRADGGVRERGEPGAGPWLKSVERSQKPAALHEVRQELAKLRSHVVTVDGRLDRGLEVIDLVARVEADAVEHIRVHGLVLRQEVDGVR